MDWIFPIELVASALAGVGYALLYNVRGRIVIPAVLGSMLGWFSSDIVFQQSGSIILAAFVSAVSVAIWSEVFSRLFKAPATVFLILGVFPMVPGAGIYNTMQAIVNDQYAEALAKGVETAGIALGLAIGILIVSTLVRLIQFLLKKNFHLPRRI